MNDPMPSLDLLPWPHPLPGRDIEPSIALSRSQVATLASYCQGHGLPRFDIAKARGAFVGASAPNAASVRFFFRGCQPGNAQWRERARMLFGARPDFCASLPLGALTGFLDADAPWLRITVLPARIVLTAIN